MEENPENDQPEPINVTGELTIQDRMKLVSGISREIKHQVKPESAGEHLYERGRAVLAGSFWGFVGLGFLGLG